MLLGRANAQDPELPKPGQSRLELDYFLARGLLCLRCKIRRKRLFCNCVFARKPSPSRIRRAPLVANRGEHRKVMEHITPHVFISAASDDLRSARHVVKDALLSLGCHPIVQEHFEPDYRTVQEMIRGRIEKSHAVVHLIGKRYGGEPSPQSRPEGAPRRSWTQMEYDLAQELGKRLYLFVCDEAYPFDQQPEPEPEDEVALQEAYRKRILEGSQLYTIVQSPDELTRRISEMRLEAAELRKEVEKARSQLSEALESVGEGQSQILAGIADLRQSFAELSTTGGIIPQPQSAAQYYHNARLYELGGDYGNARRAYLEYFRFDLNLLDPHLRFQQFLKIQEGREGARETYSYIANQSKGTVARLASYLLFDREARIAHIERYLSEHSDFGPAHYLLSQDFSLARLGSQTIRDRSREKELLEAFVRLDSAGKVGRWMLDKAELAEWREDATSRLAILNKSEHAIENPLSVMWSLHNTGWSGTIQIAEQAKEIFWRKSAGDEFESTGFFSQMPGPSGLPMPSPIIEMHRKAARTEIEVKYVNLNGQVMGPYSVVFEPDSASLSQTKQTINMTKTGWVMFREYDGRLLLYFTHLVTFSEVTDILYGLDSETPNLQFPIPPREGRGAVGIESDVLPYIEIPLETKTACVQVVFEDGDETDIEVFYR